MNVTLRAFSAVGAVLLTCAVGSAYAQTTPAPDPHPPMTHQSGAAPVTPKVGPHAHKAHGKRVHAAVTKHSKESCEHLAHHFVGTYAHKAFYNECMNTHLHVMTHVTPHPDGAKDQ